MNKAYSSFSQTKGLLWKTYFDGILNGNFQAPPGAVIDLTDKCQMKCSHCNAQGFRSQNMLKTQDVINVVNDLADWGVRSVCYDEQTEVLTRNGFKYFYEVTQNDEIATLNDDTIEYCYPSEIQHVPYNGDLLHFKGQSYDLLVTPDHNLYVKHKHENFKLVKAQEVKNSFSAGKYMLKRNADWKGTDISTVIIPPTAKMPYSKERIIAYNKVLAIRENKGFGKNRISKLTGIPQSTVQKYISGKSDPTNGLPVKLNPIPTEKFLDFFGWWITEGSLGAKDNQKKSSLISISQTHSAEKREEIQKTIEAIGFNPKTYRNKDIEFRNIDLCNWLRQFGHAADKFIPSWIKDLPSYRLQQLLKIMLKGDGTKKENGYCYYTASPKLADDIWEIALKAGYACTLSLDNRKPLYQVLISEKSKTVTMHKHPITEHYTGTVYCLTVPNHIIFVRRNGKGCWAGQCFAGGGEPSLHPDFAGIIEYSDSCGLQVGISTNGVDLSKHTIKVLATVPRFVGVSVDAGREATWTKTKGGTKSQYQRMIRNCAALNEIARDTKVDTTFKFMVTPHNQADIYRACKIAKMLEFKNFFVRPAAYQNIPGLMANYVFCTQSINRQLKNCFKLETENFKVYGSFQRVDSNLNRILPFKKCLASPLIAVYCADGYCYLCIDYRERSYGRMCKHLDLRKFWGSPEHKRMIENIDLSKCPRCAFTHYQEQLEAYQNDFMYQWFP